MTTSPLQTAVEALRSAQAGLEWYRDMHPEDASGSDDEMDEQIKAALAELEQAAIQQQPEPVAWRYRYSPKGSWRLASEPAEQWAADHSQFEEEPLYAAPPALPQPDGYVQAFYEMARMLGIEGAQAKSPQQVYVEQIKPALQRALQQKDEPSDEQLQALWNEACNDSPQRPGWCRHLRYGRAVLAAFPARQKEEPSGLIPQGVRDRQRFEAWADDQGFPLRKLETSDGYLDLRTQGAWDAWHACAAMGAEKPAEGEPGGVGEGRR